MPPSWTTPPSATHIYPPTSATATGSPRTSWSCPDRASPIRYTGCAGCWCISTGNARGQAKARDKRLAKAAADLDKVAAGAGGYGTEQKITERIGVIRTRHRVAEVLHARVGTDPESGKPTFTWWFDVDLLAAEAAADGWYALLTNIGPEQADAAQILIDYKGQPAVERRYSELKGPLAVAPMFLHDNKRV